MEHSIWSKESVIKSLPVVAPLLNTPRAVDALSNGRYMEAAIGTALGVGIGVTARIMMLRSISNEKPATQQTTSEISLREGVEVNFAQESLLYEAQATESQDLGTSSLRGPESHQ